MSTSRDNLEAKQAAYDEYAATAKDDLEDTDIAEHAADGIDEEYDYEGVLKNIQYGISALVISLADLKPVMSKNAMLECLLGAIEGIMDGLDRIVGPDLDEKLQQEYIDECKASIAAGMFPNG